MAKAKRVLSEEQKAKMAAGREAAKQKKAQEINTDGAVPPRQPQVEMPEAPAELPKSADPRDLLLYKLMQEMEELKKQKNPEMTPEAALTYTAQMQGQPTVGRNGIQGKLFKYPIEPSYYPNPVDRLYDEPSLSRFNLRENYFFDWEVTGAEYEKYGVTYAEPRFTVRLFRRLTDDNTGEFDGRMALINRQIMHEDEVVARAAADKLGITEDFEDFKAMMDEMRYVRIRDWLLALFRPVNVETHNRRPTEQNIGGKIVMVYDTETLIDGESGISKAGSLT